MDEQQLLEAKQFLIKALRIPDMDPAELEADTPLFGDGLGIDSIDALAIVVALRKQYGIEIPDAEVGQKHLQSVRTLASLIQAGSSGLEG